MNKPQSCLGPIYAVLQDMLCQVARNCTAFHMHSIPCAQLFTCTASLGIQQELAIAFSLSFPVPCLNPSLSICSLVGVTSYLRTPTVLSNSYDYSFLLLFPFFFFLPLSFPPLLFLLSVYSLCLHVIVCVGCVHVKATWQHQVTFLLFLSTLFFESFQWTWSFRQPALMRPTYPPALRWQAGAIIPSLSWRC